MGEEVILEKTYLKYISSLPDPIEKVKKGWQNGYVSITNKRLIFGSENEETSINLSDITDIDTKISIGKLALGVAIILPIHHTNNNQKLLSLVTASNETVLLLKKLLLGGLISGAAIEVVCPFSTAGKVLLDKQPVRGTMQIKENNVNIISEWLGKKQNEIIDITKIDAFERSGEGSDRPSVIFKYLKDEGVISTLVTSDPRIINFLNKFVEILRGSSKGDEYDIQLNEQQFMLLQMMYTSDIDAEMAMEMLGVSIDELQKIARELVTFKILKVSGEEEFELTGKGIKLIVSQMKKNIG
jgi:hypothetical protein